MHSYLTMLPLFCTSVQELPQNTGQQIQQLNPDILYSLDLIGISIEKRAKSNTCTVMISSKFLLIFCSINTFLNFFPIIYHYDISYYIKYFLSTFNVQTGFCGATMSFPTGHLAQQQIFQLCLCVIPILCEHFLFILIFLYDKNCF